LSIVVDASICDGLVAAWPLVVAAPVRVGLAAALLVEAAKICV